MKKNILSKTSISAIAAISLVGTTANAALWVSESFDYGNGTVDGSQAGGTGMTGAWDGSATDEMYSIDSVNAIDTSGITGLSATAGKLQRNSAPGAAQISRGLDGTALSNITADGSSIYFSIILENNRFSTGNANDSFIISTAAVPIGSAGNDPIDIAGGEGFGVAFSGLGKAAGSIDIFGLAIDDGNGAKSTGFIDDPGSGGVTDGGDTYFIVGKIDWVANGGNDTLSLYNVTDTTAGLGTAFATITADIDNSNIDTLAFAGEQIGAFDEIRIGNSLLDVGVVPEPSTSLLGAIGSLTLLLRRRR